MRHPTLLILYAGLALLILSLDLHAVSGCECPQCMGYAVGSERCECCIYSMLGKRSAYKTKRNLASEDNIFLRIISTQLHPEEQIVK